MVVELALAMIAKDKREGMRLKQASPMSCFNARY
jgi:hypothetical protein